MSMIGVQHATQIDQNMNQRNEEEMAAENMRMDAHHMLRKIKIRIGVMQKVFTKRC